jgi:hypothetical protein
VFEMFTFGGFPFDDIESDTDFIDTVIGGSMPIHPLLLKQVAAVLVQHGASVPTSVAELVRRCTARDARDRPTFDELTHLTTSSSVLDLGCADGGVSGTCGGASDPVGGSASTAIVVTQSESLL